MFDDIDRFNEAFYNSFYCSSFNMKTKWQQAGYHFNRNLWCYLKDKHHAIRSIFTQNTANKRVLWPLKIFVGVSMQLLLVVYLHAARK